MSLKNFENLVGLNKINLRKWAKSFGPESSYFDQNTLKNFINQWAQPGELWGGFQPIQNEPTINWEDISDLGLDLCFPKIKSEGLIFIKAQSFEKGSFGIQEPQGVEVHPTDIKGLLIPGLAFDHRGTRLGRGKAYYDHYLKNFSGLKVGLTWSQYFIQGTIPAEAWDIPMDFIITENFIYQPITSKKSNRK